MAASDPKRSSDDVFDLERIRELIELMKQHDLQEIDLRRDKHQIRLSRGGQTLPPMAYGPPVASFPPASLPVAAASAADSSAAKAPSDAAASHFQYIKSPMVGTFYSRPSPEAAPFVNVGDHVGPETVVCIIEAMKVFNEIVAETSGKVVSVLVSDGESVEFGTPLFRIDPAG